MIEPSWEHELTIDTPEQMHELGLEIGSALDAGDVIVLAGALGAGKTTLTRGIGEGMQVRGPVTSPTFVLARTHPPVGGSTPLVHVDAYRLTGADELDDLDLDFEASAVVIEWGIGLLDENEERLEITLVRQTGDASTGPEDESERRAVSFRGYGDRWAKGFHHA